jgi:CheY-like chemotaxis protein/glycine cleavage system H lipoate-binding protein
MTAILVLLLFVGFALIDAGVRLVHRRLEEKRRRLEREAALDTALRLEFADEARSLKRVAVPDARARILAVDDEPVVLDSFRRILVLGGYSVDTVERGSEALLLLRQHDYDFVFTDLKMPEMDGAMVVKAVHQLRPDVDVAVITGYGTIDSAVETMQHGAVDYVQKPFSEDELLDFANRLAMKREARLEKLREPTVHVAAPELAETAPQHDYCVPGGAFLSDGHVWARIEEDGSVRMGADDFARKALERIEAVELPEPGAEVSRGDRLFGLRSGEQSAAFSAPVSGRVVEVNRELGRDAGRLLRSPYRAGWICRVDPADLAADVDLLRIGAPVVSWYHEELKRLRGDSAEGHPTSWSAFERDFLRRPAA